MAARLRTFVKLWIDLFSKHGLLDHASAIAFAVLKALVPLTLLGFALLGALGQEKVWENTLAPGIKPELQPPTFHAIDAAVMRIFSTNSAGLIAFAALLSAWYISGAVRGVMTGIHVVRVRCPLVADAQLGVEHVQVGGYLRGTRPRCRLVRAHD